MDVERRSARFRLARGEDTADKDKGHIGEEL